jgi:hypothetical protein
LFPTAFDDVVEPEKNKRLVLIFFLKRKLKKWIFFATTATPFFARDVNVLKLVLSIAVPDASVK